MLAMNLSPLAIIVMVVVLLVVLGGVTFSTR